MSAMLGGQDKNNGKLTFPFSITISVTAAYYYDFYAYFECFQFFSIFKCSIYSVTFNILPLLINNQYTCH